MKLENENIKIEFLPELGGKIVSFYLKQSDFELAAQGNRKLNFEKMTHSVITENEDFGAYAFGFDDCFPGINEETILWKGRELHYPNHGEIWRSSMICETMKNKDGRDGKECVLFMESQRFHYKYKKTYRLMENGLKIRFHIENTGSEELPCIWTWHGLMRYEEDMRVLLPGDRQQKIRNVLENNILGEEGKIFSRLVGQQAGQRAEYDFSRVPDRSSKSMVKYYLEDKVTEGKCGFFYPSAGVQVNLEYDREKLPYLGVWITAGGLDDAYNCALEPTNGFYDSVSLAKENERLRVLKSGETMDFELLISGNKII